MSRPANFTDSTFLLTLSFRFIFQLRVIRIVLHSLVVSGGFTNLILEEDSINKIKDYADIIRSNGRNR